MTEVLEMVNVCVEGPLPPEKEFEAELVSITFDSGIPVTHGKAAVKTPHWEAGKEGEITDDWKAMAAKLGLPAEPYSKRAAVYLINGASGAKYEVKVKVKVTKSKNISGKAKLLGNFNGLEIEGSCETGAGEHEVTAKFNDPPKSILGGCTRISWGLDVPDFGSVSLGATLAEIYFVLGKPEKPYTNGVWAEVLRFLCGKVKVVGETDGKGAAATITTYCHSSHKLKYDTDEGAPKYGVGSLGGAFALDKYMKRGSEACNCYDQAAGVLAFSLALGAKVSWRYLEPFGYIKPTDLVGFGLCNNPFFGVNVKKKMVPKDSPERTGFGNHAFADIEGGNILDACAGPHAGTETPAEYVAASIDDDPSLYGGSFRPGTAGEIIPGTGLNAVK